jgi:hypothetical protein
VKTFKKWNKKPIEDWGCVMSDDAKSFYKAFKNYIKRGFPEAEIIGFKPNHYDTSGFLKFEDLYIYISHSIDRYRCSVDFDDSSYMNGVLIRIAKNEKDYHGGINNFCSMNTLIDSIGKLVGKCHLNSTISSAA